MSKKTRMAEEKRCLFCAIPMLEAVHRFLGAIYKCPRCGRMVKKDVPEVNNDN